MAVRDRVVKTGPARNLLDSGQGTLSSTRHIDGTNKGDMRPA